MIKKIKEALHEMSLTQQLVSIVFVFLAFFIVFIFSYLNKSIDVFASTQAYATMRRAQSGIIYNYNQKNFSYSEDDVVYHAVYRPSNDDFIFTNHFTLKTEEAVSQLKETCLNQEEISRDYVYIQNGEKILYVITEMNEDVYLISSIGSSYTRDLKQTLQNDIVNLLVMVSAILFIIMMAWVIYLIRSLSQLRNYANKIRKGEDAELVIERKDEIGDVGRAMIRMNDELKRQQQIKEELVQNISHDLKTPIATIKSYAESIKDGIYPYDSLEKSVDVIIEHSNRLEKKVQNLLLLNRMGYLVTSKETGTTELEDVIDATILSLKVIRPEVEIVKDCVPAEFFGDEEPWRVVVENLMDNALRYAKTRIVIHLDENTLSVENDGPFMSEDRINKLFKPYEKGTGGKFGLGLSIVHRIVTAYNCEVYAFNTHDGVMFKITRKKTGKNKAEKRKEPKKKK